MNHVDLTQPALVISMSDFMKFKRCRKQADLTYRHGLEPLADREAMARGRAFHALMEAYAISRLLDVLDVGVQSDYYFMRLEHLKKALAESDLGEMVEVAKQYINRRWNVAPETIANIEQPIYTLLLPAGGAWNGKHDEAPSPAVYLRNTPDIIFQDADAWIVGQDYKTFTKNVTYDNDLDFQGKISMAVMQHHYNTDHARFVYMNVRQTPPDVPKDKQNNVWREDECYIPDEFYPSKYELEGIWAETKAVARDILGCLASDDPYVWYRTDLRGTAPHGCGGCLVKDLCKDEAMFGGLSNDTIAAYAKPREYVTVQVDGLALTAEKPREFTPFKGEQA